MVDFLFLVLAIFATLAVTRAVIYDTEINLVKAQPEMQAQPFVKQPDVYIVTLSINENGQYKWLTEFNEYLMDGTEAITKQLRKQQELGLLPKEKEKTRLLVHIDKESRWEPVLDLIFAVRKAGFQIHPVYEPPK